MLDFETIISTDSGETTIEYVLSDLKRAAQRLAESPSDDDQGLASDLNQAYDIVVILANAATPDAL